jgi:hypothetical protein
MIGGITANIACSPFFEEGNGHYDFYLFLRESILGPDAVLAITTALTSIDPETDKYLDLSGSKVIKELYTELLKTYIEEAMDGKFQEYPIVDINEDSSDIYAKMVDEFKMVSLSGVMLSSLSCEDELDVAINAQRVVSSISNDKEMIRAGVQLSLRYYELTNKSSELTTIQKKDLIREIGETICHPVPIRNWEYFNMSGIGDTSDIKLVLSAMIAVILDSDNFEDCIKKSGSCFYHASFISFNAGLLAERVFGIPGDIANDGYTLLHKSQSLYDVVAEFEKNFPPNIVKKRSFLKRNF